MRGRMVNPVLDDSKFGAWRPKVYVRVTDPESPYFRQVGRVLRATKYGHAFVLFDGAMLQFRFDQVRSIATD